MSNSLFIEFLRRLTLSRDQSESLYHELTMLEDEILSGEHEASGLRHLLNTVRERGVLPMSHAHEEDVCTVQVGHLFFLVMLDGGLNCGANCFERF